MNLQQIAKRKNFYDDLAFFAKVISSALLITGAFDHKHKYIFFKAGAAVLVLSVLFYVIHMKYRKLEGA